MTKTRPPMLTVEEILDLAKQLPASERRRIVHVLEETLADDRRAGEALDMFLALAGTGRSEHTDVSSDKGKHLADVYAGSWLAPAIALGRRRKG